MLSLAAADGDHAEGVAGVERTARDRRALETRHRDRLAGHRCFVDHSVVRIDDAINRNDLPGSHEQPVANDDVADRHIFDRAPGVPMRNVRRTLDQGS